MNVMLKQKGNMAEYLLPALMLGLVAVSGAVWLLNDGESSRIIAKAYQGNLMGQTQAGGQGIQIRSLGIDPTFKSYELITEKGNRILLTNFPMSAIQSIETIGPQGTTEKYAALIRQLADQLLKAGEISESEAEAIRRTSRKGLDLGSLLGDWETAVRECRGEASCLGKKYDNETQLRLIHGNLSSGDLKQKAEKGNDVLELTVQQKIDPNTIKAYHTLFNKKYVEFGDGEQVTMGLALKQFIDTFGEVNIQRLSPNAAELLKYLSGNIYFTSLLSSNAYTNLRTQSAKMIDSATVGQFIQQQHGDTFRWPEPPSSLIRVDSTNICHLGNGKVAENQGQANCQ
jgi:hypothetical protein